MDIKIIDCSGLNCPIPVINTKNTLGKMEEGTIKVKVDNEIAKLNIEKFARGSKFEYASEGDGTNFEITITKKNVEIKESKEKKQEKYTVIIASDTMGDGDEALGSILMKGYIFALSESENQPTDILMYNSGVKNAVKDASAIESLKAMEEKGIKIQVCGTCLDFYNIKDELEVGEISNMYNIVETMNSSDKIVRI